MTEILEKWLMNSIGINLQVTPESVGEAFYDGTLFANILHKYGICSVEYLRNIHKSDSYDTAFGNLRKLCIWFKLLGIPHNDEFLSTIASKNGSSALKLLFELFVRFETREDLKYIDWKTKEGMLSESSPTFQVGKSEKPEVKEAFVDENHYLVDNFEKGKELMENHEQKEKTELQKRMEECKRRRKKLETQKLKMSWKKSLGPERKNYDTTFYRLVKEFEERIQRTPCLAEKIDDCDLKAYIGKLKASRKQSAVHERLKAEMEDDTVNQVWGTLFQKKEEVARDVLAKKFLEQSEEEMHMMNRLRRSRAKYQTFLDNKKRLTEMEGKQDFSQNLKEYFTGDGDGALEKTRLRKLHDRLFQQKKNARRDLLYRTCRDIVFDVIDLVILYDEYKKKNREEPSKETILEWKILFIKDLPLLSLMDDKDENGETIDLTVRGTLGEFSFQRYMNLLGEWDRELYPELEMYGEERLTVIGFIVHRILNLRYKVEMPLGKPADLPQYKVQALLRPVNNLYVTLRLRELLKKPKIAVIDVNTAVEFLVASYNAQLENDDKAKKQKKQIKTKVKEVEAKTNDFGVQFPDDSSDTDMAQEKNYVIDLGKLATSYLCDGLPLPDGLTCSAIIEYIKSLKEIEGWVLVNYPEDLTQVAILEYMFSGWEVPYAKDVADNLWEKIKSELSFGRISASWENEEEKTLQNDATPISMKDIQIKRNSEILPNPICDSEIPSFKSFFNKVICIQSDQSMEGEFIITHDGNSSTEKTACPRFSETVEDFYNTLEIAKPYYYEAFNSKVITDLARFILDETSSMGNDMWRDALELFEFDSLVQVKPNRNQKTSRGASSSSLRDTVAKSLIEYNYEKSDLSKLSKSLYDNKQSLKESPDSESEARSSKLSPKSSQSEKSRLSEINPGDSLWKYFRFDIEQEHLEIFAAIWETVEFRYKQNMKEIFLLISNLESELLPYRNFIQNACEECLNFEDDRARLVTNFQVMLNGVSDYQRSLIQMKKELHCRAFEMQSKLWKMASSKKMLSEQRLMRIKESNWLPKHICSYIKAFSCLYQIEIDRYVDTMQLVTDYYCSYLAGKFSNKRISKIFLPYFQWEDEERFTKRETSQSKKFLSRKKREIKRDSKFSVPSFTFLERSSVDCFSIFGDNHRNLIEMFGSLTISLKRSVESIRDDFKAIYDWVWDAWASPKDRKKGRESGRSTSPLGKGAYSKITRNELIFKEWMAALEDETARVLFRISLIRARGERLVLQEMEVIEKALGDFQKDVAQQYHTEMKNIDRLHSLVSTAIEEEVKIQPGLALGGTEFSVDPGTLMFHCPPPPPPTPLVEDMVGYRFTIAQLDNIMAKLSYVAPAGLKSVTFTMILQDMALLGHELGHPYLPPAWSSLTDKQIEEHVERWYGVKRFVNWREFIIFALDFPYPSLEELMEMRKHFLSYDPAHTELVTRSQYYESYLWFEKKFLLGLSNDLRKSKAKDLLFKLFRVGRNHMNYTAFLLAFCRSDVPEEGFANALAVVEGSMTVPWRTNLWKESEQIEIETQKFRIVQEILDDIIFYVCKINDVIIRDYIEDENEEYTSKKLEELVFNRMKINEEVESSLDDIESADCIEINENNFTKLGSTRPEETDIWKSDVHIDTVLSILGHFLCSSPVSPEQFEELTKIKETLSEIFVEKGDGFTIKFYKLLEDPIIKKKLSENRLFHAVSISSAMSLTTKGVIDLPVYDILK